jgi:hypothetical protein
LKVAHLDYSIKNIKKTITISLTAIALVSVLAITPVMADVVYKTISLKQIVQEGHVLDITRGTGVQMENTSDNPVFNINVIRRSSGKILFTVADILPGQSMSLEFTREGSYAVCYAKKQNTENIDQCFQIEVVNRKPV